jgi:hypothetical protein
MTDQVVCAVCGLVLNHIYNSTTEETIGYKHVKPSDHEPIPVNREELGPVNFLCDFCMTPLPPVGPYNVLPARTFTPKDDTTLVDDWACCDKCAGYINDGNWDTILDHAIDGQIKDIGEEFRYMLEGLLIDLYIQLRKNITGPIRKEFR